MSKPNWIAIRNDYINGNISYRKLAEKHNVSYQTLRDRAVKEKWFDSRKRQREKIQTKTEQKTVEKLANAEAKRLERINAAADKLLEKIELATEQLDMYLSKDSRTYTRYVIDKQTQEKTPISINEEVIKSTKTERIDRAGLTQITRALKDLKDLQLVKPEENQAGNEKPTISINVIAATKADMEDDE